MTKWDPDMTQDMTNWDPDMTQDMTNYGQGPGYDGPRLVTASLMAETSTVRSDEEFSQPGPTLSFLIPVFYPF